jgi:hypothetical protein
MKWLACVLPDVRAQKPFNAEVTKLREVRVERLFGAEYTERALRDLCENSVISVLKPSLACTQRLASMRNPFGRVEQS